MSGWVWLGIAGVLLALLLGMYLSSTAGRLDRLHRRIETSRLALDAQLLRRSSIAIELASSGLMDPAASLIVVEAAHAARTAVDEDDADRALAESDLTAALVAAFDAEEVAELEHVGNGPAMLDELGGACRRVQLSRRFLNDAVRACRQLRRQRMVRWFRLAGHAPWPDTWEMDDTLPQGLEGR